MRHEGRAGKAAAYRGESHWAEELSAAAPHALLTLLTQAGVAIDERAVTRGKGRAVCWSHEGAENASVRLYRGGQAQEWRYKCSVCPRQGNALDFVKHRHNVDFVSALDILANTLDGSGQPGRTLVTWSPNIQRLIARKKAGHTLATGASVGSNGRTAANTRLRTTPMGELWHAGVRRLWRTPEATTRATATATAAYAAKRARQAGIPATEHEARTAQALTGTADLWPGVLDAEGTVFASLPTATQEALAAVGVPRSSPTAHLLWPHRDATGVIVGLRATPLPNRTLDHAEGRNETLAPPAAPNTPASSEPAYWGIQDTAPQPIMDPTMITCTPTVVVRSPWHALNVQRTRRGGVVAAPAPQHVINLPRTHRDNVLLVTDTADTTATRKWRRSVTLAALRLGGDVAVCESPAGKPEPTSAWIEARWRESPDPLESILTRLHSAPDSQRRDMAQARLAPMWRATSSPSLRAAYHDVVTHWLEPMVALETAATTPREATPGLNAAKALRLDAATSRDRTVAHAPLPNAPRPPGLPRLAE